MSAPDGPDLEPQTTATQSDALSRPGWENAIRVAAAVAVVVVIGVGGYFGVNAVWPRKPPQTTPAHTLAHIEGLPAGATQCDRVYKDLLVPFNASARGTPMTSCPFAEQVRREYSRHSATKSGTVPLKVVSPTTELQYDVTCLATGVYATCSGGAAAVIYLYDRPTR